MLKTILLTVWSIVLAAPLYAFQAGAGQTEFLPADKLPATDQLPAAPLLVAAYAFAWIAVFFFLWTVWRRLGKVEREMHALEQRQAQRSQTR
jgi:CcmD family protein